MTKRMLRDRLARIPPDRIAPYTVAAVIGVTAAVFLASGLLMEGGFERAWKILVGIQSPFGQVSALGVALSALGYLAVPAVIGLGIADFITRFINARLKTLPQVVEEIERRVTPKIRKAVREELADRARSPRNQNE